MANVVKKHTISSELAQKMVDEHRPRRLRLMSRPKRVAKDSRAWASQHSKSLSAMAESADDGSAVLNSQW
jgi:hypothetical protein